MTNPADPANTDVFVTLSKLRTEARKFLNNKTIGPPSKETQEDLEHLLARWYLRGIAVGQASLDELAETNDKS